MPSLTPHRDAVQRALGKARHQLEALAVSPNGEFERRMSLVVMEAHMLSAADMIDAGRAQEVQFVTISAFANVLLSHAMNLCGGNHEAAADLIVETAAGIGSLALERLSANSPDVRITERPDQSAPGTA